jgi:glucokinase
MSASQKFAVGVDLGGTNIVFGLTDMRGRLLRRFTVPTQAQQGARAVIRRIADGVWELLEASSAQPGQVRTLGIGSPGPLNSRLGIIYSMPNLPGFHNTPMRALVQKMTGIQTYLENDAKSAAFG